MSTLSAPRLAAALPVADYEFDLPADLIAQTPATTREGSRLLVLDRSTAGMRHSRVTELATFLRPGDLLIVNDTRVMPARLRGVFASGAKCELLLLHPHASPPDSQRWLCLGKPGKRLLPGAVVHLAGDGRATVIERPSPESFVVEFGMAGSVLEFLERHGEMPLPPYIRRPAGPSRDDAERYQTVFARHPGAVAAPTAGLHFSPALIAGLEDAGLRLARITLHVGPGTFLPVRGDDFRDHVMAAERYDVPAETVAAIAATRRTGGRVIAVGTTTTRALESAALKGLDHASSGWTDLFIVPGHAFRAVDGLFTNFHLPGSTLLLLVSAFSGRHLTRAAYAEAIRERYRFYSYGDAMLIL